MNNVMLTPTGFIRSHNPSLKPAHEKFRSLCSRNGLKPVGVKWVTSY